MKPINQHELSLDLVFIHIHKTGGKSVSKSLNEVYGDNYFRYNRHQLREKGLDHIDPGNNPIPNNTKALSGHIRYKEVKPILNPSTKVITWLRNPIDRLISNFYWRRQLNIERPGNNYPINDPNITLEDFIRLEINQNRITKFLEGIELEELFFIGFMEHFEDDLHLLTQKLNWSSVSMFHINKNKSKPESVDIDEDMLKMIESLNQNDLELYQKAREMRK